MKKADGKNQQKKRSKKGFDCVEMKRRIQAEIYEEIKNLTPKQELEYWRKSAEEGPWGEWWREIHARESVVREKPVDKTTPRKARRRQRH